MTMSTELDILAAREEVAPRCIDAPTITLLREPARNDGIYEQPAIDGAFPELWVTHAFAANGFGDAGTIGIFLAARPMSDDVARRARAYRSFILGGMVIAAVKAIFAVARQAYARSRQRRRAMAIDDALSQLNDHTLRDLGFRRGEIRSVTADVMGEEAYARARAPCSTASLY